MAIYIWDEREGYQACGQKWISIPDEIGTNAASTGILGSFNYKRGLSYYVRVNDFWNFEGTLAVAF